LTATLLLAVLGMDVHAAAPAGAPADVVQESIIEDPVFYGKAHVYQAGKSHARSVLLIHGIGENAARDWQELIPKLARDYHVVTFDLPGFGRSSGGNKAYTPENYVAFVKFVAGKYTKGPFVLIGHSMGGAVALRYAATYPDDVQGLVIADVPGILHRQSYSQYLSHLGIGAVPNFYPNQKEHLHNLVGNLLGAVAKMQPDLDLVMASPMLRDKVLDGNPAKIAGLALVLEDFSGSIQRVRVPVLVIWGAKDPIAPLRTGKVLAANLAQAQLKVLPDSAHTPMEDTPAEFDALVLDYLQRPAVQANAQNLQSLDDNGVSASAREGSCNKQRGRVFEGDYDSIVIVDCRDVLLRNVRVREVRITDASVTIEGSRIGGPQGGLRADDAYVTITSSVIQASVAINAIDSRLDLAGVRLIGSLAAVQAPYMSKLVFSVSHIASPHTTGSVHGWREVGPKNPL
jgi:pimeloyl-ACP methyl ester carboxylesterase